MNPIDAQVVSFASLLQLAAWFLQAWLAGLVGSIFTLSLIFLHYGADAEQRATRLVASLRLAIRWMGGRMLLAGVHRHFSELHDSMFGIKVLAKNARTKEPRPAAWLIVGMALLAVLMISNSAHAQEVQPLNVGLFDEIGNFYVTQAKAMAEILRPLALTLFGSLSVISFALFLYRQVLLGDGNLPTLIGMFAFEILKIGFFLYLVQNGPELVMQFLGYFTDAGAKVGQTGPLSASTIVVLGFDSCFRIFDAIGAMGWGDTAAFGLPLALAGLLILACFTLVGVLFLVRMIELHLVVYGGILLLGFGGLSFTRDIPKNYLTYVISAGTQLFMLYVIIGLGMQLAQSWPATLTTNTNGVEILHQALYVLVSAATFASLAWSIPKVASSLVSGSISMGAADVIAPAAAAGGAVTVAATAGAATIGGLAKATTGAMQAQTAGMALATEQGASGIGGAVKGLGHAANAIRSEVGAAVKSSLGLAPPSPNAEDRRGRPVGNFGTRAANRLGGELQSTREQGVSAPGQNSGLSASGDVAGDARVQSTGHASTSSAAHAAPAPNGQSRETRLSNFNAPQENNNGRGGNPLKPPQLPPDTASGAVLINLNNVDD